MGWRKGIPCFNSLLSHSDHGEWNIEGQDGSKKPVLLLELVSTVMVAWMRMVVGSEN